MPLRAIIVPVTPFEQNCTVLACTETARAAVVDPGGDLDRIVDTVQRENLSVERILLTHGHIDHAGGAGSLARRLGVPVAGPHSGDRFWLEGLPLQASRFGFEEVEPFEPDRWLDDGDTVTVGGERLAVIHCPGHTPGHVVFYHAGERLALVGDVLFRGSIGRTDFPGGDHDALLHCIRERLFPLGDDVTFIPGHGPVSTFGEERRSNSWVGDGVI